MQDRRSRQSPVREERRLRKRRAATVRDDRRGDPRQGSEQRFLAAKRQRNERGARFDDLEPEFAREVIGKSGRAELGDLRPAGRDHQRGRTRRRLVMGDMETAVGMRHVRHR